MESQEKYPDSNTVMYPSKPTAWGGRCLNEIISNPHGPLEVFFLKMFNRGWSRRECEKGKRERESASELFLSMCQEIKQDTSLNPTAFVLM